MLLRLVPDASNFSIAIVKADSGLSTISTHETLHWHTTHLSRRNAVLPGHFPYEMSDAIFEIDIDGRTWLGGKYHSDCDVPLLILHEEVFR
jgi:hypothetical protein